MTAMLTLDRGGLADLPAVMQVMEQAFDPAFGEAWTSPQCTGLLTLPGTWILIARSGGEAAGFAMSRSLVDEAELLLIAVRPALRGRGIGTALVDATIAEARARGLATIHLETREGNGAARIYRRHGFAEVGRRRGYYRGADGGLHDAATLSRAI